MEDIAVLRRRLSELEEENREYRRLLHCPPVEPFRVFGFEPKQLQVLGVMYRAAPALATRARLSWLWDGNAPEKSIDVCIHNLRRNLKPYGVGIQTIRCEGYLLDSENKARLEAALEQLSRESAA